LHQQAKDRCATATPLSHVSSRDRGRNRQEQRCVSVFDAAHTFTDTEWSDLLGTVIRINPGVFARLRSFAFNILKANRRSSLSQDRYRAAIGGLASLINLLQIPER